MNDSVQPDFNKWERFIAYAVVAFTPLIISNTTFDSYLLPKSVWLMLCAALWTAIAVFRPIRRETLRTHVNKPLFALLLVSLLSILVKYHSPLQVRALLQLATFAVLFVGMNRFWRIGGSPERLVQILMMTACAVALYGLLQDYGIDFVDKTGGVRDWRAKVVATLGNPNFLAGYLCIVLPVVVGYAMRKETRFFGFLAACVTVLLIAACHAVTFCVGAAIGSIGALIAALSGAFFLTGRIRIPIARTLVLLAVAVFAVGWYMTDNPYNSHGRSLYKQAWESSHWWSGMGARRFNWQTTRIMIDENPLFGVGFGNYLTVHERYQGMNYKEQWHAHDRDYVVAVDQPHFQLLETASEVGPLGVLALCWLFMAWMKTAGRTLQRSPDPWFAWGCYAGVWVAIVHSFSSFPFHLPASGMAVVALGSYLTAEREPESIPKPSPMWLKVFCAIFAAVLCVNAFMQYFGNQYLRSGFESTGLESIYYLDKSRSLDPWSHQTHYLLGVQYAKQGWNKDAIASFEKAIRLQEDVQAHKWLANVYQSMGNREAAIREMERVIEINPVYPGHYRDLIAYLGESADPQRIEKLKELAESLEKQMETN